MASEQKRIILWCTPRSVSTAFVRAMENVPDIEIFVEPFLVAHHFGPERRMLGLDPGQPVEDEFTYDSVRNMLEGSFSENKVVFVKDMGYAIDGKYEYIPKGYKHCILIRNPLKSFTSYFKQISKQQKNIDLSAIFKVALPPGFWFKELCELVEYLEQHEGTRPIIIDADDLINHPEPIMRKFCESVGLVFSPSILKWNGERRVGWNMAKTLWNMHNAFDWHKNSFQTTGFDSSIGNNLKNVEYIPDSVHDCAQLATPFYEKLCLHKLNVV